MKKNQFFFNKVIYYTVRWLNWCNMSHILHPWQNLTHTLSELITQRVSGYLCDVYSHPLFMKKKSIVFNKDHVLHGLDGYVTFMITHSSWKKNQLFFNKNHILHWLNGLTNVIWIIYYTHGLLLLWRLWPPTFHEKNLKTYIWKYNLNRIDGLTGAIFWVKKLYITPVVIKNQRNIFFLPYFKTRILLFGSVTTIFWMSCFNLSLSHL